MSPDLDYRLSPPVSDAELNALFSASNPDHEPEAFGPVLSRSLAYVCAYDTGRLVGFANVAWDGGAHAFILDPTVHPAYRRRGVGSRLVAHAERAAREGGAEWLHVDYEPHLRGFYEGCGFRSTEAGLIRLRHGTAGAASPVSHGHSS